MPRFIATPAIRKWLIPCFVLLSIFLIISYGCGGGGGGGSSILLPPGATTGVISGKILSDGTLTLANIAENSNKIDSSLRSNFAVNNAEVWIEDAPEIKTLSTGNGDFVLQNVPYGSRRVVARLETALKTYLVRSNPSAISESVAATNVGELTITEATNRVQGFLKTPDNQAIANAVISLWGITFRTDANGHFITPPLPATVETGEIKIPAGQGMRSKSILMPFLSGSVPEIEITLSPIGQTKNAPVAFLTTAATNISPNQMIQLIADGIDLDETTRDNLSVDWSVTDGILATTTNRWIANWTAPDLQTTATASIVVSDRTGFHGIARLPLKIGMGSQPGNQKPLISDVNASGTFGDISITYNLADANQDEISINVFYSIDGGTTFKATTSLIGSTTGILPAQNLSIIWRSAANIIDNQSSVIVKITPSDQVGVGTSAQSTAFSLDNTGQNSIPVISSVTPTGAKGDILLTYNLEDADNNLCSISLFYSIDGGSSFNPTSHFIGTATNILPGTGLTLTWNSAMDVTSNKSGVVIRLVPDDGLATGTAGLTSAFPLSNNDMPSIANVIASGTSGDVLLGFDLQDPNSDPCSIAVAYSIDNGTNFISTTSLTGKTTGIVPATGQTIVWNSAADINGDKGTVKVRITPFDGVSTGTSGISSTIAISNNDLPIVTAVSTLGASGSIQLTYTLTDPNNDLCSLSIFYSIDGGANYLETTNLTGATTGLSSGASKTIAWNSTLDVNSNQSNVKIKIIANDGQGNGNPGESANFAVSNNTPPVLSNVTASGAVGNIQISFDLADTNNHNCAISVLYSIDGGTTYNPTVNLTGTTQGIAPGTGKIITWNSASDVNGLQNNVKLRILPNDGIVDGTPGESPAFTVNNNDLPVVTNVTTTGNSGSIVISFDLAEPNNDPCTINVFYSIDNGVTYTETTDVSGTTSNVMPGTGKNLTWDSIKNIAANQANVKIKVVASDNQSNGNPGESATFPVNNNQIPVISAVTVIGASGDLGISYTLTDGNNDLCSINLFYSVDGGATYIQTGNIVGSTTGLLPGSNLSLTWNSASDIPGNQNSTRVKIVPNDGNSNGTEGQSSIFAVNNNNLPVITNLIASGTSGNIAITYNLSDANGDNSTISLFFSTNNGVTYTQTNNLSGSTANIPPGTNKSVIWNSALDVFGNQTAVKVKIVPVDLTGAGSAGESSAFTVNNNNSPTITNVTASGNTGNITITYAIDDPESNVCSISLSYSIDGGATYLPTSNASGTLTGITSGIGRTLTWLSALDVPSDQANVRVSLTANDGFSSGAAGESPTFALSNSNQPPVVSSVIPTGSTGDISISYNLADANNDPCSIEVYYSTNGGGAYVKTDNITGKTTNIMPGSGNLITWNSPVDINGSLGNISVRVVPIDRDGAGTGANSGVFSINNASRPTISNVSTSGTRGNISISYDLSDPESNPCNLAVYYSLDNGINFTRTTQLTGQTTSISPAAGKSIIWNSSADINGSYSSIKVKVLASDGTGYGTPGVSNTFSLANDGLPNVLRIINSGNSGQIVFTYDLLDPNSDLCSIEVYYSIDGGLNYNKTTNLVNGLISDIIPGSSKAISWDSTLDIMGYYPTTKVKIIPNDGPGAGIPGESMSFSLRNNRAPIISTVSTTGNSGDVDVIFTLSDTDNDVCSITPEYSTDNGTNWFPTYNVAGDLTNVTPGVGKTFTWHSADDFLSTHSQVRLRLTPNDGAGNGTTGMSTAFAVANNSLPAISNVTTSGTAGSVTVNYDLSDAENNPCSITLSYSTNGGTSFTQTTFVSGQTTNVIPGTGQTLVWESSNNVSINVADVRLRLVPNDGTGNGTAGVSSAFALSNNTNAPPSITALARTGTSGNITITYTLVDANGDPCSTNLYFSTDGGTTFYLSHSITGAITNVLPGSGRTIVWNSVDDVNSTISNVLVKLVPQDTREEGTGMTAAAFNISNNSLPTISNVVSTGNNGPVPISYTLADSNLDPCTVGVYFSIDGGLTFTATTNVSGTLTGVTPGSNKSLTWNSSADILGNQNGVRIRLVPNDPFAAGSSGETVSFPVNNNQLPVISSITASGTSGNIDIAYNLADGNNHNCSIEVYYSTDGGANYLPTTDLTGATTNIAPGTGQTFTWNSAANINRNQNNVRIRVVPTDTYATGTGGNSSSFSVLNNQAPVISSVTPAATAGNVTINYSLADANDNQCSLLFYYSKDGGATYIYSSNVTGLTSGLTPGGSKIITWNSAADINTSNNNVRVRLVANDGAANGSPGDSATFSILNNQLPILSNIRTSGTTGDINLTYDISDGNTDPLTIGLSFSVDNGVTYTAIAPANLSGLTSAINPGLNKTITWNSAADITGDKPAVRVKILPNDGLANGSSAETANFAVANNNLPIISNAIAAGSSGNINVSYDIADANNDNCSIQVYYSTNGGASYALTTNLIGATSAIVPGNGKIITWNSALDIPGSAAQVKVKVLPNDGTGAGVPGETTSFAVTNNSLPAISNVTTSVSGSDVTINYQLADAEADTCSIAVFYSIDSGATFTQSTFLTGATSVTPGARSIVWNSINDFKSNSGNIRVKVQPNDGKGTGASSISSSFALSNNTLPTINITSVVGAAGPISITYNLADTEQNACTIEVYYSTNGGISYGKTTSLTGLTSDVSPATGRTITWNSGDNYGGKTSSAYIRVIANDGFGNGVAGVQGPFTVDNNAIPVVSSLVTANSSGNITLSFNLSDANSHACDLTVDYSIDGGTTWASATGIVGAVIGTTPGTGRTLTWDSRQNFTSNQANVKVRITPQDPYEVGTSATSSVFAISNNNLPIVSSISTSGSSGDVSVSYNLADSDSDPCGISVAYSINNGAFTATSNLSGTLAAIPPGNGKSFIWNSASDVKFNTSNVRLRVTPNDGTANGTPGESSVFSLTNNELPVINNVSVAMAGKTATFTFDLADSNNDSCNISAFYSTDNGATWNAATGAIGDTTGIAPALGKKITWKTSNNLAGQYSNVIGKLVPNDGTGNGSAGQSPGFAVNNTLPATSNIVVTGAASPYTVTYDLSYPSNESSCTASIWYSTDDGATWALSTHQAPTTGVLPGVNLNLSWDATVNLPAPTEYVARLQVRTFDGVATGTSTISDKVLINNAPPALSFIQRINESPTGISGNQTIEFEIYDPSSTGSFTVQIEYTVDNGTNWQPITANKSLAGLTGGTHKVVWESYRDYVSNSTTTRLRMVATDGELQSDVIACEAGNFSLSNSHSPNFNMKFLDVDGTGGFTTAAVTDSGQLWVWGYNNGYYYGVPGFTSYGAPQQAVHTNWVNSQQVECTQSGVMVLRTDGTIRCVGYESYGEFGNGVSTGHYDCAAEISPGLTGVKSISAAAYHTLALLDDGTVWAYGQNGAGNLGNGNNTNSSVPVKASNLSNVVAVAAGGYSGANVGFSLALKADGSVWSWGYNNYGQLGHGDATTRLTPTRITGLSNVKAIAAGCNHSLFLLQDGTVWSCGYLGAVNYGYTPVQINSPLLVDIEKVFAGKIGSSIGNSFAIDKEGNAFGWGNNGHGQLGLGNVTQQALPIKIPAVSRITAVATGKNISYYRAAYVGNSPSGYSGAWMTGYRYYAAQGDGAHAASYFSYLFH